MKPMKGLDLVKCHHGELTLLYRKRRVKKKQNSPEVILEETNLKAAWIKFRYTVQCNIAFSKFFWQYFQFHVQVGKLHCAAKNFSRFAAN